MTASRSSSLMRPVELGQGVQCGVEVPQKRGTDWLTLVHQASGGGLRRDAYRLEIEIEGQRRAARYSVGVWPVSRRNARENCDVLE
jgi:hypothetical protein